MEKSELDEKFEAALKRSKEVTDLIWETLTINNINALDAASALSTCLISILNFLNVPKENIDLIVEVIQCAIQSIPCTKTKVVEE